jgi:Protein of unknown function (DUF2950)
MRNLICRGLAIFLGLTMLALKANAQVPEQRSFATPEEAATALLQALKSEDLDKLRAIFGPDAQQALSSGDPLLDRHDRAVIALAMQQSWRWEARDAKNRMLVIGDERWPFPVPLTKKANGWQFDTQAGQEEVLARRVGRNELFIIDLCRAYPTMQQKYASQPHDGKPAGLYAKKIRSTPGRQDGLYWSTKAGEQASPLGDLAAEAATEGYAVDNNQPAPFWGYYFRILTAQGKSAPGGARSYIIDDDMSGGFALIAYPARYGYSGVMTFIVNQSGVVYQKDLGPETSKLAGSLNEYNPDKSWKIVQESVP